MPFERVAVNEFIGAGATGLPSRFYRRARHFSAALTVELMAGLALLHEKHEESTQKQASKSLSPQNPKNYVPPSPPRAVKSPNAADDR